jgi:hypothetical protein
MGKVMSMARATMSVGMALAVATAAGCSADRKAIDGSNVATADSTPARAPEAEAVMFVTDFGIGDLRAGMTLEEAGRVATGIRLIPGTDSTECSYLEWTGAPAGVLVMFDAGRVARVDIDSAGVRTEAGAQVGDSEARIDSIYRGRVTTSPHKYEDGHYLTVAPARAADSLYRTVFETVGGKVTRFRVGRRPQVEYVEGCS